jgi:signal transduction histidine kinase
MEFLSENIIVFFINLTGLLLALWVYFSDRKQKLNQLFALLVVSTITWVNFARFANLVSGSEFALLFIKLTFTVACFWFPIYYYFVENISIGKNRNYLLDKVIFLIGGALSLITISTSLVIKDITFEQWGVNPILGEGRMIFYSIIAGLTILIIVRLIKKYLSAKEKDRLRIQYFLVGTLIYALFNVFFNVILPAIRGDYQYYQFGNYSIILLLAFTAYAIVRRQLFGIKVVLTILLVALIAILLLLNTLLFSESISFQILNGVIFVIFLFFGYYLIRSVQMEIKRREEMERLSSQLKAANIELDKLSKSKSEFISIASHQLRTPLAAVKGYISMMLGKTYGKAPEKMKKPLENVYNSNERLITLVNDLLNLSRLDAGKIEFNPELVSLEEMTSGIIDELRINAEKKGLYMKLVRPSNPLPKIMADRDKLRQVILNIVDNAIKYTKEGGVTLELKKLNQEEAIKISDTGEGMGKEELDSLFQMFSRATAGTQLHTEGAGIGLYVAKQFIEMHGGKIWAESEGKGKGSTFTIQLPTKLDLKLVEEKTRIIKKESNK